MATLTKNSYGTCLPRWGTPRTESRPNRGHEVAAISKALGYPLLPWQRYVADLATELIEDEETGLLRPAYSEISLLVPRQNGKTQLVLALMVHRALLWGGPQRIAYTAQTGSDARKKLMTDFVPALEVSSLFQAVKQIYRGNGDEAIIFKNASRIDALPTTKSAGHGKTINGIAVIDEARFDYDDMREAALKPTMLTCPDAQLFITSAAGDQSSIYWRRKVDEGRRNVENGLILDRAYIEYSLGEDDDIDDPASAWKCNPSMGPLITEAAIRARRQSMPEGEYRREHCGQWTIQDEAAIPAKYVQRVLDPQAAPTGRLSFGVDVALDRSYAAISVADELGNVELLEHREGVSWVTDRLLQLVRAHKGHIVVDGYSPANSLIDRFEAGGLPVTRYALRDVTSACGILYDDVLNGEIHIRPHPALEAAIAAAKKKQVASGWLWSRTVESADLTPLFAATLAHHHATHRQPPETIRSRIY